MTKRWVVQAFIRRCWAEQNNDAMTDAEWNERGPAYTPTTFRTKTAARRQARRLEASFAPGMVIIDLQRIGSTRGG